MFDGISAILLFLLPLITGFAAWQANPRSPQRLKLLLSFSGAYLLALCFLHLIPDAYESDKVAVGGFILGGFVLQLVLEFLSGGIEHGHFHFHSKGEKNFPITLMFSLCLHTFLECLPLTGAGSLTGGHEHEGDSLLLGILLHNIPVTVTLMTVLMQSGISRKSVWTSLLIFSLTGPAGMLAGHYFQEFFLAISPQFYRYALALVIGIFLHVSTTILFESGEGHRFNLFKLGTVFAGSLLAFLAF